MDIRHEIEELGREQGVNAWAVGETADARHEELEAWTDSRLGREPWRHEYEWFNLAYAAGNLASFIDDEGYNAAREAVDQGLALDRLTEGWDLATGDYEAFDAGLKKHGWLSSPKMYASYRESFERWGRQLLEKD
jgi:hypothetical protein